MKRTRNIFWPPLLMALSLAAGAAQAAVRYNVVTIGGLNTDGHSINNAGQITGSVNDDFGMPEAFLYSHGTFSLLGTLGGGES
ncbi:MAG TPA: hypothetical protein VF616_32790, partial [Duganella sp.]|uniref:hypothetical protein n=1 Tax=Duganella sp. TaxID=1904440 RepID=UPI002F189B4D